MTHSIESMVPGLESGLFGRLRREAAEEWTAYVGHPFVRGLADGTLPEECFRHFLVQDYLYLLQYARACALAIYKSDTLAEMRAGAQTVSGLLLTELSLHVDFCRGWGLDEDALQAQPAAIETLAYSGFVLDRAQSGDLLDLLSVLSACLVGYAEIGARLGADPATRREGNPYLSWIETYSGAAYTELAGSGIARLNALGATRGGDVRFPLLLRDFRMAVRLECAFWSGAMAVGADAV
jgi:thiaminase/transcriptional activator TenA